MGRVVCEEPELVISDKLGYCDQLLQVGGGVMGGGRELHCAGRDQNLFFVCDQLVKHRHICPDTRAQLITAEGGEGRGEGVSGGW